ncbi:MAG TPA: MauE/DoxX family redox-associated membrane protein [Bryobacteraceae bacterium]|nr:MauE/DoxX family redox-associated membrane protein [Bryobacteraceae bacterium]
MWRSALEIWVAWSVVALVAGGLLFTAAAWKMGRLDERTIHRLVLWSRIGLSITFLYSGLVKLTNPWYVLATSIVDFKVGITETSALLRPLAVAIPWAEVAIAILLLFPIRWVVLSTGAVLMAFLGLGVASEMRGMQVTCGCWGGTMLVGPLWFGEHGGMFLMALAADRVFAKRLLAGRTA